MTVNTISSQDSTAWAESFANLYQKLKPYRKIRSVITIRNDSSSTLLLGAAFVSNGVFVDDPGVGESLAPGEVQLLSVKASVGMPGYEIYGLWQVASPSDGDTFAALVACRWSQPKRFTAVTPPDVRVGLTSFYGFKAFLKKTSFTKLKHTDIESGTKKTHFGQVREIIKQTAYTTKDRAGAVVTGISAINSEFVIADIKQGAAQVRKKPKPNKGRARRHNSTSYQPPLLK